MNQKQIVKYLKCLGVHSPKLNGAADGCWVGAPCPLAPWTHSSGTDSHPSFAIQINSKGRSRFNCFSCEKGDLFYLHILLSGYGASYDLKGAYMLISAEDEVDISLEIGQYGDSVQEKEDEVVFSEMWKNSFPKALDVPLAAMYLAKRDVPDWLVTLRDLRFDTQRKAVCFPIRNFKGTLVGMRGRYIDPPPDGARYHVYKTNAGKQSTLPWYGEDAVSFYHPVLMVESVFDYLSVRRVYSNVIAPMSVGMSKAKLDRVKAAYDVVTLYDQGKGGEKARILTSKHLKDACVVNLIPPDGAKDPGEMSEDQLVDCLKNYLPDVKKFGSIDSGGTDSPPW